MAVSDSVVDVKLIPIGDRPKNKPTKPVIPKLSATERTAVSTGSMRFDPTKRMFTRQYPGRNTTKTKPSRYLKGKSPESPGMA